MDNIGGNAPLSQQECDLYAALQEILPLARAFVERHYDSVGGRRSVSRAMSVLKGNGLREDRLYIAQCRPVSQYAEAARNHKRTVVQYGPKHFPMRYWIV